MILVKLLVQKRGETVGKRGQIVWGKHLGLKCFGPSSSRRRELFVFISLVVLNPLFDVFTPISETFQ